MTYEVSNADDERPAGRDLRRNGAALRLDRLWVRTAGRILLVPIGEVDWIAAEGDYARLHAGGRSFLIGDPLTALGDRLAADGFVRIHRSTVVNLSRVVQMRRRANQDHILTLSCGVELRLSRTYYRRFMERARRPC